MLDIDIHADLAGITKRLTQLEQRELPFATALALTDLARETVTEQQSAMDSIFDRPTPFTKGSLGVIPARKNTLVATVFVKDIAAAYLEPFEFGGRHALGQKRGILNPLGQPTNAYGNLSQGTITRLKSMHGVFVGSVKTKNGEEVRGVWQRPYYRPKGQKKGKSKLPRGANTTGRLRLLVRFEDPEEVTQDLGYRDRARSVVARRYQPVFTAAMARALGR